MRCGVRSRMLAIAAVVTTLFPMAPKVLLVGSFLLAAAACTSDDPADPAFETPPMTPSDPLPLVSGTYAGHYLVPAPAELADAATYPIDHVDWEVEGGSVNLHYDLPEGLVGGAIPVSLAGPLSPGDRMVELDGDVATGVCVATATTVTCREEFFGLGDLPICMTVVTERAAAEYAGPAAHRQQLAVLFDADPIGFVQIDLESPVLDRPGDDD